MPPCYKHVAPLGLNASIVLSFSVLLILRALCVSAVDSLRITFIHMPPLPDKIPDKSGQAGFKATGAWEEGGCRPAINMSPLWG